MSKVSAIVKSGEVTARRAIDVDFVNVSNSPILADATQRQEIIDRFQADGEQIMGGFNLHPGEFSYTDLSETLNERFGTIDSDSNDISQLCANIPQDGDRRALRFAFVDNLTTADPDVTTACPPACPVRSCWTGLSFTMTEDQAFMLARNPLFQPREAPVPAEG